MKRASCIPAACAAVAMLSINAAAAVGATHTVMVGGIAGNGYAPSEVTVQVGDTVLWDWDGGLHDVESGVGGVYDGNFDSGAPTTDTSATYQVTFDQAFLDANPMPEYEYPYYCAVHWSLGMTGKVIVQVPTIPTISEWGLVVMTLVMLTSGTVILRRFV